MARSDLLVTLVKAASTGDQGLFRRTVEAVIAEERGKKHDILADRLTQILRTSTPGPSAQANGAANLGTKVVRADDSSWVERIPQRGFEEILLPDAVERVVRELVEEHHRTDLLRSYNLMPRNRVLLAGEPGNGKTSLAEAIAHALAVPLVVARYEGLIGSYLGETAGRIKRLFDHARARHCVLFFDEFDTVGKERGDVHETGEIKRVVSSLLLQIDDLPAHVVAVAATNHPELLDRAVWRRFQIRVELPKPSGSQAEEFLRRAQARTGLSFEVSAKSLANKLAGASYSELEEFVADVFRRYVLGLPEANLKQIVAHQIDQWQSRFRTPD
jgi:AAA+ superfamily predicted ATPase